MVWDYVTRSGTLERISLILTESRYVFEELYFINRLFCRFVHRAVTRKEPNNFIR